MMSSEHLRLLRRLQLAIILRSMKTIMLSGMFLVACGGASESSTYTNTLADSGVSAEVIPYPADPSVSAHPRVSDAADETPTFICQPCCLNIQQHNCLGGNASMTGECTDLNAPAVCNAMTHECVGLACQ